MLIFVVVGTIFDDEKLLEFAQLKTFTQFDLFGTECSYYQIQPEVKMPSDAQRIDRLHTLKENGHLSQILMSHDLHTKHRLVRGCVALCTCALMHDHHILVECIIIGYFCIPG